MKITFRIEVTSSEFKRLEAAAHALGKTVEAWTKETLVKAARKASAAPAVKLARAKR